MMKFFYVIISVDIFFIIIPPFLFSWKRGTFIKGGLWAKQLQEEGRGSTSQGLTQSVVEEGSTL
jgi:hypothetical protein